MPHSIQHGDHQGGQGTGRLKLDPLDRHLLTLVDANPGASLAELAEALVISSRSVSRRMRRLQDAGVLRVLGRTLPEFGGRAVRMIRVTGTPEANRHLAGLLSAERYTSWVRLSRDSTTLLCGTVGTAAATDERLLGQIHRHPGVTGVSVQDLLRVWNRGDAVSRPARELDETDRALLAVLAQDGRMPNIDAAQALGIDASTVSRRRRRLTEEGILYLEADILPEALAGVADVMLWATVQPGMILETALGLRSLGSVRFVAATSGTSSLLVNALLPDTSAVIGFLDEELGINGVTGVETLLMGPILKRSNPEALGRTPAARV